MKWGNKILHFGQYMIKFCVNVQHILMQFLQTFFHKVPWSIIKNGQCIFHLNHSRTSSICANCVDSVGQKNSYWTLFFLSPPHFGRASPDSPASKREPSKHRTVYIYCSIDMFSVSFCTESNIKLDQHCFFLLLNEAKLPCAVCMDS